MSRRRLVLILWNAEEARAQAERLRGLGFDVEVFADRRADPRILRAVPPDAFVIDVSFSPSQGRELGGFLRRAKATRHVPLVFVEGEADKTEAVRSFFPDAAFGAWDELDTVIEEALAAPPADPRVPGAMDAYAGASLAKKLGIKADSRVRLMFAPEGFETALVDLPAGAKVIRSGTRSEKIVLVFMANCAQLEKRFERAAAVVAAGGRLWVLWPKKSSDTPSDLTQGTVRAFGLSNGWVDYKICSVDATWSGLCFARRPPPDG